MKKTAKTAVQREWKLSPRARVVPRHLRHQVSAEAMEPRNTKVRVSIYLDLDVLDFFKGIAKEPGAPPYQTRINAVLRNLVEKAQGEANDASANLRQAKGLIDAALRKMV
jgi:uncharacterized protein (DUF4415 family)